MANPETGWRGKLHPAFFEVAPIVQTFERTRRRTEARREKELRTVRRGDNDRRREIDQQAIGEFNKLLDWCAVQLQSVQEKYPTIPYNPRAYSYLHPGIDEPDTADPFTRFLHWMRHRQSVTMTWREFVKGSLKAVRQMARTVEDWLRILVRRERIKAFQGDDVHREFLQLIICFQQQPLTAEERADCADAYCGCGVTEHDVDALRKQFARLSKDLNAAFEASRQGVTTPPST